MESITLVGIVQVHLPARKDDGQDGKDNNDCTDPEKVFPQARRLKILIFCSPLSLEQGRIKQDQYNYGSGDQKGICQIFIGSR